MEIKNSEWKEFAEFIARQSTHPISNYIEDGTYTCCPFSTMERAYAAFNIYKSCHSSSEVRKFYDVDYDKYNPEYTAMEESYREHLEEELREDADYQKYLEMEICYDQQYPDCTWQDEWDDYISDREKQITRIAHELADRYEYLPLFGAKKSWNTLVFSFYALYELNHDERQLFVDEYYAQHYYRYGYI